MARIAIHPGEHLAEELDALKMSAAALGRRLEVPTNRVTEILNGQRAITGTPRCAWRIFSARAPSSGSTFRPCTNCAWPGRRETIADEAGASTDHQR